MYGRVTFDRHEPRYADGATCTHPTEVVAYQVDDHEVLRPRLGRCGERFGEARVIDWIRTPGDRSLDRLALHGPVRGDPQKPFRRRAGDTRRAEPQKRRVRGRIRPALT